MHAYSVRTVVAASACAVAVLITPAVHATGAYAASVVSWVGGAGLWDVGSNWSGGAVPGPADDVVIDVPRNALVTVRSGVNVVHSLVSRNPIVMADGSLRLMSASSIDNTLTQSGGAILGPGDLTVSGLVTWTGGSMAEGGRTRTSRLLLAGLSDKALLARTLENVGSVEWRDAGQLRGDAEALVLNQPGATFKLGDRCLCGNGRFINLGTLDKISGTGPARFEVRFENSGQVLVHSGQLELAGGGISNGTFWSNLGAGIVFSGGIFTLRSDSRLDGPGLPVRVAGAALDLGNAVSIKKLALESGTVNVFGSLTTEQLVVSGGALGGPSGSQFPWPVLTVLGSATWTSGSVGHLQIVLPTAARAAFAANAADLEAVALDNSGSMVWAMHGDTDFGSVQIQNRAGATLEMQTDGCICASFFDNHGRVVKTGPSRFAVITHLHNQPDATLEVKQGRLQPWLAFEGVGGRVQIARDAELEFKSSRGNGNDLGADVLIEGPGTLRIHDSLVLHGVAVLKNLDVVGGAFIGVGPLIVDGPASLTGSSFEVPITARGAVRAFAPQISAVLTNAGTFELAGATTGFVFWPQSPTPTIVNAPGATLHLLGPSIDRVAVVNAGRVVADGVIRISSGFSNSGTLDVTTGRLTLGGSGVLSGAHNLHAATVVRLVDGAYTLADGALFSGQGLVAIDPAMTVSVVGAVRIPSLEQPGGRLVIEPRASLTVGASYVQGSAAVLEVGIGGSAACSSAGRLTVGQTATLAGSLAIRLTDGCVRAPDQRFTVISAKAVSGAFGSVVLPPGVRLDTTPTSVTAQAAI